MRHLDLFSGIGGFALAARWVGWETVGFCEIDPYCQKVLGKHWPDVPIYEDVKDVTAEILKADGIECDLITGGFPCQDISYAGKGAGIDGKRSGLWSELSRIISDIQPRYAVLENVAALLNRGLERVTGDLAAIGYDCEWHCIPASAVGAPHCRDRIWIIAYPEGERCGEAGSDCERPAIRSASRGDSLADSNRVNVQGSQDAGESRENRSRLEQQLARCNANSDTGGFWDIEPDVGRVANGIPKRVDRLKGLGNAIVPQVAEVIFRAIDNERYSQKP